jgi:Zn-dependent protease with chaperone function
MLGPSDSRVRRPHGTLFDGKTAQAQPVSINVLSNGLQLYGERARSQGSWSFEGLRAQPGLSSGGEAHFMHAEHPDARLVITDTSVLAQIKSLAPGTLARRGPRGGMLRLLAMAVLIVALLAGIVFVVVPRGAGVIADAIPKHWENEWGKGIARQFAGQNKLCSGQSGRAALDALTARLLDTEAARNSGYSFTFTVIDAKSENAFATLGGQVVVFSKLIKEMKGPDELAGVLAHEIGHVTARHPLTGFVEATFTMMFAGLFGGGSSDIGGGMASLGGVLAVTSYSRAKEAEADEIGARILNDAGIRLDGLADFFERLQRSSKGTNSKALALFSTHPALGERAAQIRKMGAAGTTTRPALTPAQWQALKGICG